jgi:HPt (histidine-containing phosphotransfer) domain-containing protein
MTHICYVCQSSKGVDECVGCNQFVCKTHAGHIKQYISISGRKGRGCQQCIDEGIVTPDYGLSSISLAINDAVKRLENRIQPKVQADLEKLADKIKTDSFAEAHILVKELEVVIKRTAENVSQQVEQTADRIVADNLIKIQETLTQLTQEITKAISHQRIEVSSDAEKIIQALSKTIQISFIYMAFIIVFGFGAISWLLNK